MELRRVDRTAEDWPAPRHPPGLGDAQVHVWRAFCDVSCGERVRLSAWLCPEELERASRFRRQADTDRFVARRGILRALLGLYLGTDPADLGFDQGPRGKPSLAAPASASGIRFSASHSHGLALYAIMCGREVGVDVEAVDPDFPGLRVAERFFSPCELNALGALPEDAQQQAFFACWTRKEAVLKATGEGLALPLRDFDVTVGLDDPPAIVASRAASLDSSRWSLADLRPADGYAAALAVQGQSMEVRRWTWEPGLPAG